MVKRRRIDPFHLVIVDDDNKVFNVEGPMIDDDPWNWKIVELQKKSRKVRCFSRRGSKDSIVREVSRSTRYSFTDRSILSEPEDRTSEFIGLLPNYARNADRRRVVKIFCRRCNSTRWAEMEVDYPGEEILRNSQVGDHSARCLYCGEVADDPYNWHRKRRLLR